MTVMKCLVEVVISERMIQHVILAKKVTVHIQMQAITVMAVLLMGISQTVLAM